MNTFFVQIQTPDGCFWEGETSCLTVPLADGKWQILTHHLPAIAAIEQGECRIGEDFYFVTDGGEVFCRDNQCVLLCKLAAKREDWEQVAAQAEALEEIESKRRRQSFAEHKLAKGALAKAFDKMQGKPTLPDDE